MPFHMISQPTYDIRTVPCGVECSSDCIESDPREHRQDYATALCGVEVVRHQDEYCNVDIANPGGNTTGASNASAGSSGRRRSRRSTTRGCWKAGRPPRLPCGSSPSPG